jgi:DNA-directed RNA polymerase specialized sigma24 family protein
MKKVKKTKTKTAPKKSYYKPKAKKSVKKVVKKKYKSYYKPKVKKVDVIEVPQELKEEAEISTLPPKLAEAVEKIFAPSKRPVKYLNNRDLLAQVILSKKKMMMSNELAKMLQLLTSRYAKKGNFANYTYNDDMQSYAMLMLVKTWSAFDPAKSSNPFAFFTQCIKNSFIQYLNQEKRQRDIKDEVLVDKGLTPSFSFQYEYEDKHANTEAADHEVIDAPTKLHEDVDPFIPSPNDEEESITPEAY